MESQPSWRLTLLGTGPSQGVPSLGGPDGHGEWGACDPAEPRNRRTRTSALLDGPDGTRILIDAGPDCRAQLLAAGAGVLDAVIFTHAHADHFMGMDELRQINRNTGQALPVYGFPETLAELQARFDYAFQPVTGGFYRPALTANKILPGEQLVIGQLSLRCLEQDHQVMRTMGIRAGSLGLFDGSGPDAGFNPRCLDWPRYVGGRLLPAWTSSGPCQPGDRRVLGGASAAAPHRPDAYGQRHGLAEPDSQSRPRHRAWS
jgi:hypothetical protein